MELAQTQGRKWQRVLQHERDQRIRLEEVVEQLARQHSILEQAAKEHQIPRPGTAKRKHGEHFFVNKYKWADLIFKTSIIVE